MEQGHFYFLKESYYTDFPDPDIQRNHETIGGVVHNKPCFYALKGSCDGLFWMIPISSKTDKYHRIADQKIKKYGRCDTIIFGNLLGHEKAFLIQNMVPITAEYINNEYLSNSLSVRVDGELERLLMQTAKDVLNKQRRGIKLIFPDVISIEKALIEKL